MFVVIVRCSISICSFYWNLWIGVEVSVVGFVKGVIVDFIWRLLDRVLEFFIFILYVYFLFGVVLYDVWWRWGIGIRFMSIVLLRWVWSWLVDWSIFEEKIVEVLEIDDGSNVSVGLVVVFVVEVCIVIMIFLYVLVVWFCVVECFWWLLCNWFVC